jgi:ElaB/YqjD/DUF883 family membrane-anchored ribosome-binding protein
MSATGAEHVNRETPRQRDGSGESAQGAAAAAEAKAIDWIRRHPWSSLLGATALGFAIARILRPGR